MNVLRFLALGVLVVATWLPGAESRGRLIDRVWSGAPVSFAMLSERGWQFIAYYDAERRITVAGRKLGGEQWTTVRPPGGPVPARKRDSNVTGWDSHNYLRLALDRDGCLHLSGNMHVDPLVYYRTRVPFDVTTLERLDRMTGDRETRCTYPVFFNNQAGDLVFRYRDGSSGNGSDLYNIYDATTRTWRRLLDTPLLEGEGQRNAYATQPTPGPDGRFHLVWMWRETPDASSNHSISYARSRDLVHWENSRGESLRLPITLATSDVVDPAKVKEGLINMTMALGFDAAKRPVVTYHRYDANGKSQVYAARPRGGAPGWDVVQVSDWSFRWEFSGGGSIDGEVGVGPVRAEKDGTLVMNYNSKAGGSGRWRLDAGTLARTGQLPAVVESRPREAGRMRSTYPGMTPQTLVTRSDGRRWVLRWETLGRNRDKPRAEAPPPTELWLYELPDAEVPDAVRVGS
ncbi:MAG: BNR repeat-containing protein [Verrucomicrobia bacterium]|nr:BNR repeat-containing protein [Verrucomicrobiota bacterium]